MPRTRSASVIVAFILAAALFVFGAIVFTNGGRDDSDTLPGGTSIGDVAAVPGAADLTTSIAALQTRLAKFPLDYGSWTTLGFYYISQARATADPSYYPKADEAFVRVVKAEPDNADALAGQAALANARHEFADARDLAQRAVAADAYDSTAKGVLADAQIELGDYANALDTLQAMLDLKPEVPAYTRASYAYELRGDLAGAQFAMNRALNLAASPTDKSFSLFHLGELSFNTGDYPTALKYYQQGVALDPTNMQILDGQAKVEAAMGDTDAALRDYETVVERLPQPIYLVEYGELLDSLGRADDAKDQYAVADAAQLIFAANGVEPDIDVALYDADHGRPADALKVAQAQYATRRSVQVEDAMAWALHANGRDAEALPHAIAAQAIGTNNALWDYHRGMIQLALGKTEDARASLTDAIATNPHFSSLHAPLAEAALASLGPAS